jgi:hypothetical protein
LPKSSGGTRPPTAPSRGSRLFVSVVAYSSLGYGDHGPVGHAHLLTGVETLNGLLLIGWSASFT